MTDSARFAINLSQCSIEIEGSESFVRSYADRLEQLLEHLTVEPPSAPSVAPAGIVRAGGGSDRLGEFGSYLQLMDKNVTDVDRVLAAGFWLQLQAKDDCFGTGEASKLLLEHGIKVGNPSQCIKQSINAKNLFMTQKGRYRVSGVGRDRLRLLMGEIIPH